MRGEITFRTVYLRSHIPIIVSGASIPSDICELLRINNVLRYQQPAHDGLLYPAITIIT